MGSARRRRCDYGFCSCFVPVVNFIININSISIILFLFYCSKQRSAMLSFFIYTHLILLCDFSYLQAVRFLFTPQRLKVVPESPVVPSPFSNLIFFELIPLTKQTFFFSRGSYILKIKHSSTKVPWTFISSFSSTYVEQFILIG